MSDQESKPRKPTTILVAFFGVLAILSLIGFIYPWRLEVAATEGEGIDATITYLLVVTGIIMLAGHGVLCWFLWQSDNSTAEYKRPSSRTEWKWAVIPVLLMIALSEGGVLLVSGPVWDSLYVDEPEDPLVVQVVGKQFEWWMHYPGKNGKFGEYDFDRIDGDENPLGLDDESDVALDDIWKRGALTVQVGRPVVLHMHTRDVIHSFFVPHFRVKQDLIPGFVTRMKFTPTRTGTFELVCTELCGLGHYKMRGEVRVLSKEDFEAWVKKTKPTFG